MHMQKMGKQFSLPFHQGDLVTFKLPYVPQGAEFTGPQNGVVLTTGSYNASNNRTCICPILGGRDSANEIFGIPVPTLFGDFWYLRPDLSSYVDTTYGKVTADERGVFLPNDLIVAQAVEKLLGIFEPSEEKLNTRGKGFLAFGQIGWFNDFPYIDIYGSSQAPVLCLTPPEIYAQTRMAIVARGYSHMDKFAPQHSVAVSSNKWFDCGFFACTDFRVLSIERLAKRCGREAFSAGPQPMKAFSKKAAAAFIPEAREAVKSRYVDPKGTFPAHVISSSMPARRSPRFTS